MKKHTLLLFLLLTGIFAKAQTPEFSFNGSADLVFKYPPRGSGGRAIVHDEKNILALNYGGDFSGGTRIGSNIYMDINGNVSIGNIYEKGGLTVAGPAIFSNRYVGSYNENIRLPSAESGFSSLVLGAIPGSSGTGMGQWSLIKFPESQQSKFSIRHADSNYFSILTNGNIGIGTSIPAETCCKWKDQGASDQG